MRGESLYVIMFYVNNEIKERDCPTGDHALFKFFGIIPVFTPCFNGIIPVFTPRFNGIIPLFGTFSDGRSSFSLLLHHFLHGSDELSIMAGDVILWRIIYLDVWLESGVLTEGATHVAATYLRNTEYQAAVH